MQSIQRINAQGKNQHGDDYLDYAFNTAGLTNEMKAARDRARAKSGAVDYYYAQDEGETVRWAGKLAQHLDLAGKPVDKEALIRLARGFHPHTGEALCKNAGEEARLVPKLDKHGNPRLDKHGNPMMKTEGGHRVGFDLTTTPPKSVSIAFAQADDDLKYAILQAHRKAVDVALGYMEEKVETRRDKAGRTVIGTQGLIVMQADHLGNRNLEMNLHTHNLILGVALGEDGQWGTFDAQELYRHKLAADVIYKNELAANMRALGFGIEQQRLVDDNGQENGLVSFEIAGIDRELIEMFSTRWQEIVDYASEHGVDRQAACLATRKHKDEPAPEEMMEMWTQTIAAINEQTPGRIPTIEQLMAQGDRMMRQDDDKAILERLHTTESYFCDHNLVERLGMEHMGQVRLPELLDQVEQFKEHNTLSRLQGAKIAEEDRGASLGRVHTEERYAAPWMVEWEQEVVHRVASRVDEAHQRIEPDKVQAGIHDYEKRKGFTLSDEQRSALEYITAGSGGVAVLEGIAGAGKTTVADVYSEIFKADGRNMLGVCVSNKAAKKLEAESGMPCRSVAKMLSLLDRERMSLSQNDVLVIDEAGMIPTDETRRLLSHAQRGGAKVIMQGDRMQIQPVGAGSGMSLALMALEEHAQLTENRRQKHVEDKAITGLFYERDDAGRIVVPQKGTRSRAKTQEMGQAIMGALVDRGCIDEYDTQAMAMEGLVQEYMASTTATNDKIVLASTNAEISALNAMIRQELKDKGALPSEEVSFRARDKDKHFLLALSRGDRIVFTENEDRKLGVSNGDGGVVERIRMSEEGGFDLAVRLESTDPKRQGKLVEFNTRQYDCLNHNYATTIHRAQGQSIQEVYHLANLGMLDNHSALVAFSRLTKGHYRLYGDSETIERLGERFALERLKGNAITEGIKEPQSMPEKVLDAQIQRQSIQEKTQMQSSLTDEDLAWVREHGQALARAVRLRPALEERRARNREISR